MYKKQKKEIGFLQAIFNYNKFISNKYHCEILGISNGFLCMNLKSYCITPQTNLVFNQDDKYFKLKKVSFNKKYKLKHTKKVKLNREYDNQLFEKYNKNHIVRIIIKNIIGLIKKIYIFNLTYNLNLTKNDCKIKKIFKIKNSGYIINSIPSGKKYDELKYTTGKSYFNIAKKTYSDVKKFDEVYYKVFSQNGEDGVLDYLIDKLKIKNLKFVELGVGSYKESNTRFLFIDRACKGLIIDKEENLQNQVKENIEFWKGDLEIINTTIKQYI